MRAVAAVLRALRNKRKTKACTSCTKGKKTLYNYVLYIAIYDFLPLTASFSFNNAYQGFVVQSLNIVLSSFTIN
jgi:hypothetical protein